MDLALYLRVVWRFRVLVLCGLILAVTLAALSFVRVDQEGVTYRQNELWSSTTRVLVTQSGFPEGRLYGETPAIEEPSGAHIVDPARFNNLAVLYSQLATSDSVLALMSKSGPIRGQILAASVVAGGEFKTQLPMIDLTAIETTPEGAIRLAQRSSDALAAFIREQQRASNVPAADRAVLVPVIRPAEAMLFQPRSKTMPIVVFLAIAFITIALAFVLENLRPRTRSVEPREPAHVDEEPAVARRRTA